MRTPSKTRSKTAAVLLTAAACTAPGCVSAPQTQAVTDPPAPLLTCPPGAEATYKRFEMRRTFHGVRFIPGLLPTQPTLLRHGQEVRPETVGNWGLLPAGTRIRGRVWFGRSRIYGRLTEILLPDGARPPVCLVLFFDGLGLPIDPGGTQTEATTAPLVDAVIDNGYVYR